MWNWNFHKFCPESISDGTWFVPFQSKMKPVPWFQKNCLVPLHHWLPYWLILPPPLGLCHHWTSNRFLLSGLQHNYPKKVEKLWKFYNFIKKITHYEIPLLIKALRCAHILRPPGHLRWHMIPFWNRLLRAGDLPKTDFHFIASGKNGKRKKKQKKRRRIRIKFWVW